MKFRHLIVANLTRRRIRTALTLGSFAVALFLFGVLAIVRGAFQSFQEAAEADRLIVTRKVALIQPLPTSYRERLLRIPGVKSVSSNLVSPGFFQNDRIPISLIAIDIEHHRAMYPEFIVPDGQWNAFLADRQACIVGERLAARFNWKIGDRIPIKMFMGAWDFNIRGIYGGREPHHDTTMFWYHLKLLEEKVPGFRGRAGWYVVRIANPGDGARVVKAIDREFANSPAETSTATESEFSSTFVKMIGNIQALILSVGGVVFFTLLLVTGNTMAIAVRERVAELAVLKAIGFSDSLVLRLVLAESLAVASAGGAIGLGLAKLFTLHGDPTGGLLRAFYLPGKAVISGWALALGVGLASGLLPAISAMRLRVVEAMRRV